MKGDVSKKNKKSALSFLKGRATSCFNLRTVPIITVSGAHSGVGKTKVAEILLRALKGWSALKVTVTHREGKCPARKNCHTCDELKDDFSIIDNKRIIETKGKDTDQDKTKRRFLDEWVRAVNEHGGFGKWRWDVSLDPADVTDVIARHTS